MHIVLADRHHLHPTAERMPGYGRRYPEVPERIDRIRFALEAAGYGPPAAPNDFGMAPIEAVHTPALLDHLRTAWEASRPNREPDEPFLPDTFARFARRVHTGCPPAAAGALAFDVSCPLFAGTWAASYSATQAAVSAADHVLQTGGVAYALGRPPGHHAGRGFHGGFCYTNHTAAAAQYLHDRVGGGVVVLDLDYHHGNGTQDIFAAKLTVRTVSIHADPRVDYPYFWGFESESDVFNQNVPLPHGTTDDDYLRVLDGVLEGLTDPDSLWPVSYLVLAAGFDLMAGDPVPRNGGFAITVPGLRRIAERIASLRLPTVIVQEGGYNLDRLGEYAVTLLDAFRR